MRLRQEAQIKNQDLRPGWGWAESGSAASSPTCQLVHTSLPTSASPSGQESEPEASSWSHGPHDC